MSLKLKALGLALFAALAVGAVSVVSAGADNGGVMHSDVEWTHIKGEQEGSLHENVLISHALGNSVTCATATYTGNAVQKSKTPTEVTVTPTYAGCKTTDGGYPVTVDMTDCSFVLTFTDISNAKHHTAHLECPPGVTHAHVSVNPPIVGECHITIPPQTPTTGGVVYTQIVENGKHALTLDVTVEGITHTGVETGFGCGGEDGHTNTSTLKGTVKATGFDTAGNQVNITVTTKSS